MPRTALKCNVDLKLQAISCPGTWLPNKDDVYVSVCLLGQHRRTPLVTSIFPLLFHTEMSFSKVFWSAIDPSDVVDRLEDEHIYVELVQLDIPATGTVLARFELNLKDFLFPYPSVAPKILTDRDVLMEKTLDFPNGLSPRLEFSCRTTIRETPTPYTDAYESAMTGLDDIRIRVPRSRLARSRSVQKQARSSLDQPLNYQLPTHASNLRSRSPSPIACDRDHIGSHAYRPTHEYCTEYNDDGSRKPFVVRRVDKRLIHRVPGEIAPEPFPTSVNVEYRPRSRSQSRRPRSISLGRSSSAKLRSRSMSPARTKLTRGLYGVYESGRRESPAVEVIREPVHRPAYLDKTDDYSNGVDDAILAGSRYRYRPRSPSPTLSRYSRLREKLEEESLSRRIEDRVREALIRNRSYYVPYDDFYSRLYDVPSRYRYPYTSDSLDRLADDLERARIRRYYP